jgi:hypothetical protein
VKAENGFDIHVEVSKPDVGGGKDAGRPKRYAGGGKKYGEKKDFSNKKKYNSGGRNERRSSRDNRR